MHMVDGEHGHCHGHEHDHDHEHCLSLIHI